MTLRSKFAIAVLGLSVLGAFCSALSQASVKVEANTRAELVVNSKRAILSLRFLKPVTDPLSTIAFSVNGRPLESQWFSFPTQGQSSEVVALLDLGDPNRADQIRDSKSMMLLLGATRRDYQHFVFGSYAATGSMFLPTSADPRELISMVAMSAPLGEPSNLTAVLLSAIISLEKTKGDRRAVLVFTDGHNDSAVTFDRVAEAAQTADVAISFILSSSARTVDMPALARLAERTGGNIVSADRADNFLRNPLQTIETGGTALASLEQARRYFWEKKADVVASISFGQKTLQLVSPADIKDASILETVSFLAHDRQAQMAAAAAMAAVVLLALVALLLRRYRKARGPDPAVQAQRSGPPVMGEMDKSRERSPTSVVAILESENGVAYPVQTTVANIGRATDNEVVISDPAVSRLHAVMRRQSSGQYSIENRSGNGTFVNNQKIEAANLVEGDLITIGSVTLRYILV